MILAQFWLTSGPSEAVQQNLGFLGAPVRPGRAVLGHGAGGLSRADWQPAQSAAIRHIIFTLALRYHKRDCLSFGVVFV